MLLAWAFINLLAKIPLWFVIAAIVDDMLGDRLRAQGCKEVAGLTPRRFSSDGRRAVEYIRGDLADRCN